jgi:YHS domain-containing protein
MNMAHEPSSAAGDALDPVCGMTVDVQEARTRGLALIHANVDYYFCGKGCKLDFQEDPDRYLDPSYVPSM